MNQYDVMCPKCGTLNKGLYLDETDGWMICSHCGAEVRDADYQRQVCLPYTPVINTLAFRRRIPTVEKVAT